VHCCRGKAINIAYSQCVSVALGVQHAVRTRSIILSSMLFYISLPETVLTSVLSAVSVVQLFGDMQCIFVVKLFVKDVGIFWLMTNLTHSF
jgi:hypothetical protein